jgi:hypothetical protein
MTRDDYRACLTDIMNEVDEAEDSHDESRKLGAMMALEAFLSVVKEAPAEELKGLKP